MNFAVFDIFYFNYFNLVLFLIALLLLYLSVFSFRQKEVPSSRYFGYFLFSCFVYVFFYSLELASHSKEQILLMLKFEYFGIVGIPFTLILLSLNYTGRTRLLTGKYYFMISIIPALTILIYITHELHSLFYIETYLVKRDSFILLEAKRGIWYWVNIFYINLSLIICAGLFLKQAVKSQTYRRQSIIMLSGSFAPWLAHLVYIKGWSPLGLDISPFGFLLTGLIYGWAIFYQRLINLVPVARGSVFDFMLDAVIVFDISDEIVDFNKQALKLFPELKFKNKTRKFYDLFRNYPELNEQIITEIPKKENVEIRFNNEIKYFTTLFSKVIHKRGMIIGKTITFHETTETTELLKTLKEREERLKELNATKDKFFSIIAHDLKNPFMSILGFGEMIKEDFAVKNYDNIQHYSEVVHSSAQNVYRLLENLLEWSRSQTGRIEFKPRGIELNDILDKIIQMQSSFAASKDIALSMDCKDDIVLFTDYYMLDTILRNLISNAIKFTNPGGEVKVAAGKSEDEKTIIISVMDNGKGLSDTEINNLFKPEYKIQSTGTKGEKGTGLGLVLCKEFVMKMGGEIKAESSIGKGSKFTIIIPT